MDNLIGVILHSREIISTPKNSIKDMNDLMNKVVVKLLKHSSILLCGTEPTFTIAGKISGNYPADFPLAVLTLVKELYEKEGNNEY